MSGYLCLQLSVCKLTAVSIKKFQLLKCIIERCIKNIKCNALNQLKKVGSRDWSVPPKYVDHMT